MQIWFAEIDETKRLFESIKGQFPDLDKELEQLIRTEDANVVMLYSRRCLEVIISDLCESELKRPRKTEPLQGIIDKLNKEGKVPSNIVISMQFLNSLSSFGTHPKEFDPEQVKPVLNNLTTIIKWYQKYKEKHIIDKAEEEEEKIHHSEIVLEENIKVKPIHQKNLIIKIVVGILILLALVAAGYFIIPKLFKSSKQLEKSLAVLPFKNDNADSSNVYFINGVMEEILTDLQKIKDLRVISRTSVEQFRNTTKSIPVIAKELGVNYILEGSGQKYGSTFRLRVQLIKATKERHLWAKPYEQEITDVKNILRIQTQIAQEIAAELQAVITRKEEDLIRHIPTNNLTAYNYYLKGNNYMLKYSLSLAMDMYSKAIQEDSTFTAAYARRAGIYLSRYWTRQGKWQNHYLNAQEDIKKGLELNPELPELRSVQALACYVNRDFDKALNILKDLKVEAPKMAELYQTTADVYRRQGKWEESIRERKIAVQLDPFHWNYLTDLASTYRMLRQYDKQIECYRQGSSLIPDIDFNQDIFYALLNKTGDLTVTLKESGFNKDDVQALKNKNVQYSIFYYTRQYDKLIELISKDNLVETSLTDYQPKVFRLAFIYYLSGNKSLCKIYSDSAVVFLKKSLNETPDDERLYSTLGKCYAFLGDTNEAIKFGKKAVDLMPINVDAFQGAYIEKYLMEIYILANNYNMSFEKMEYLLSIPSSLHVGEIMINPIYDKLRNLPRFKEIINSANKKLTVN